MKTNCSKFPSGAYVEKRGHREDALCNADTSGNVKFNKVNVDNQFNLARPAFKYGAVLVGNMNVPMLKNKRTGDGDRNMIRNNFISPPIKGREQLDFEQLQAQEKELQSNRNEIQLGDKTIEKLFKIQVPDTTDVLWVTEYNKRKNNGETAAQLEQNPPLGRPQRQVSQMKNFAQQGQTLENKVEMVQAAVLQGNVESNKEMGQIAYQITALLSNVNNLQQMSEAQLRSIHQSIARLNIPKQWQASFRDLGRVINQETFNANKGPLVMFLLSNIPSKRPLNEPLVSWHSYQRRYNPAAILQAFNMGTDRWLDLQDRSFDTVASLATKGLVPPPAGAHILNEPAPGMPSLDF
jgi:hypothetical protein